MYPIDPGEKYGELVIIGANQTDTYEPLYTRKHPQGQTIIRLRLSKKEKEDISNGQDILLGIMQHNQPFQPISFWVPEL